MRRAENLDVAVGYVAEIKQAEQRRPAGAVHANQAEKLAGATSNVTPRKACARPKFLTTPVKRNAVSDMGNLRRRLEWRIL